MQGEFWQLTHLSDAQLLERTRQTLASGRKLSALLLAHLAEVEERRLHLHAACSSLFDYCVNRLGMSEDEACRRIDVARLARKFPALFPLLAEGAVSLSVAALVKPHLSEENQLELLQSLSRLSVAHAREALAARFPQPDVASQVRKLPVPRATAVATQTAPLLQSAPGVPPPAKVEPVPHTRPRPPIEPLAAERYRIQLTAGPSLKEKLQRCRDLMRHANPSGDFAPIIERALDLLLDKLMRERFGAAHRPRLTSSTKAANDCITRATKRATFERDGLRCSWVDREGNRCDSRAWLEYDHRHPRAKGGTSEPHNVRLLCRAHNRLAAEMEFGRDAIDFVIARYPNK